MTIAMTPSLFCKFSMLVIGVIDDACGMRTMDFPPNFNQLLASRAIVTHLEGLTQDSKRADKVSHHFAESKTSQDIKNQDG